MLAIVRNRIQMKRAPRPCKRCVLALVYSLLFFSVVAAFTILASLIGPGLPYHYTDEFLADSCNYKIKKSGTRDFGTNAKLCTSQKATYNQFAVGAKWIQCAFCHKTLDEFTLTECIPLNDSVSACSNQTKLKEEMTHKCQQAFTHFSGYSCTGNCSLSVGVPTSQKCSFAEQKWQETLAVYSYLVIPLAFFAPLWCTVALCRNSTRQKRQLQDIEFSELVENDDNEIAEDE